MLPIDVNNIFSSEPGLFNQTALDLFAYQYAGNTVYRRWCDLIVPADHPKNAQGVPLIEHYTSIPALPIGFFKTETVQTGNYEPALFLKAVALPERIKANIISKTKPYISAVL